MMGYPYGMIAGIAMKVFSSFSSIDSCNNEDDAEMKGERHSAAYRGLRFNTCHIIQKGEVLEEWPVTGDPMLEADTMCCYDSPLSRILMVQMKAQTGRGWTSCTGITLNELSHMSWRQCSAADRGTGVDGATVGLIGDMRTSYQFRSQCMDLEELKSHIESQVPVDFSETHLSEALERLNNEWTDTESTP
jgi:hypothetical protein